jgi:hypothetical protein
MDAGSYYHELFLRGRGGLAKRMTRTKVKGTKYKAASNPDAEPDFYKMPPVLAVSAQRHSSQVPQQVSDESSSDGSHGDHHRVVTTTVRPVQHVPVPVRRVNMTTKTTNEMMEPIDFGAFENNAQFDPLPLHQYANQQQQEQQQVVAAPMVVHYHNNNMMMMGNFMQQQQQQMSSSAISHYGFNSNSSRGVVASSAGPAAAGVSYYQPSSHLTSADQVLDAAVDEIFNSSTGPIEDTLDLHSIWNAPPESVQDDEQLGYLLDRFLKEGM